jgi:hypothetical protein
MRSKLCIPFLYCIKEEKEENIVEYYDLRDKDRDTCT